MTDWHDGDDIDEKAAKAETKRMLDDPKHKRPKGSPEDLATVDDPVDVGDDENEKEDE